MDYPIDVTSLVASFVFCLAAFVFLGCVALWVVPRWVPCGRCNRMVWAEVRDLTPPGSNPLGVRVLRRQYECKSCGHISDLRI